MPYVDGDGTRLFFQTFGTGEPLVLIHGAGASGPVWFQQVAHFSRSYLVIVPDMRGFGVSICEEGAFHPRFFPDDLRRILDALELDKVLIVAQSLGAWMGLPFATRWPERVGALVLSGSPTPAYGPHHAALNRVVTAFSVEHSPAFDPLALGFSPGFVAERPDLITLYAMLSRRNPPHDFSVILDPELRLMPGDLEGFAVPTLVMGGATNQLLGGPVHVQAAALIPGALSFTFSQSGHSSYLEEPGLYNRVVEDFFDDVTDGTSLRRIAT